MSESKQDLTKFPLLKLPFLAMKNAVKHMGILDIYKFSKTSKVSGSLVKLMKLKTESIEGISVTVHSEWGSVDFVPSDSLLESCVGYSARERMMKRMPIQYFFNRKEDFLYYQEDDYPKELHAVPDYLEGCLGMAEQMNRIFEMKTCTYDLWLPNKEPEEWMQLLSKILAHKCSYINIHETSSEICFDRDVLDYLMGNLSLDARLFMNTSLPENYTHENLFKFQHFLNNDASWVTMDLLKSLRNVKSLTFYEMNFDSKDINEFLRYFINSEEDILEDILISINEENRFVEGEILDQLITVPCTDIFVSPSHLMKVRHSKNRKSILIKLQIRDISKAIELETVKDIEPYKVQFELLELMEREKDLEKELEEIEENENRIGDGESNDENALGELVERRKTIVLELTDVREKLLELNNYLLHL